jgi:alpha,alpha-trehalose-phosphate synthase [UDP-forming]
MRPFVFYALCLKGEFMKRFLLLILPVLIIVIAGFTIFGMIQGSFEEQKLMDDLSRKASAVAESAQISVLHILQANDLQTARNLVESFQKRERMQGCIIYDKKGRVIAVTKRLAGWENVERTYLKNVLEKGEIKNGIEKFNEYTFYRYILPVKNSEGRILGAVEVAYDTSYVFNLLTELWKRISIFLIVLVSMTAVVLILLQKRIFIMPVLRLTDWFKRYQKGEINENHPIGEKDEFASLISEVEQVALSLRVARKAVKEVAGRRVKKDEFWTEGKLKHFVHVKLGDNAFFMVSNREPYMHVKDDSGKTKCIQPAGGVVTAIDPLMRACGGTWIAHGAGNADRNTVNTKDKLGVPPDDNRYILKRIWLSKEEEQGYYYGFSNEGLWPLCHMTHTRPIFKETDWEMYKKVNQKFADKILEELPVTPAFVFIQDYHFTLLPKMIKEKRPDVTVAMFWHIPWPNPEVFAICPFYKEIIDGMLGCDLLGFHVQYHCNNFLDTVNRLTESRVDTEKFSVVKGGKETFIKAFPISIDPAYYMEKEGTNYKKQVEIIKEEFKLSGKTVAVGVDRIDYTKGILERINAIDVYLEKNPEQKGKFVFIQIGAPSRTHIKSYHDLISDIDASVDKINWKYGDLDWKPVIYTKRHLSIAEIIPYYKLADICIVSSLHDGMNLVAKEYIAAKEDLKGVLLLSSFTGAIRELTDAIAINPYAASEFAGAIKMAVDMPEDEKIRRMGNMRALIAENNVYKWAGTIINDIALLKKPVA